VAPLGKCTSPHGCYSSVKEWMVAFRRVKEALVGITLDQEILNNAWEGVTRNITVNNYDSAFRRWLEQAKKCMQIGDDFVKKSWKLKKFLAPTVIF
jgi:hypothetical protein